MVGRTLDIRKNPYFARASRELFVCYKNKYAVGRTAVFINPCYHSSDSNRLALFGYYECIHDSEAAGYLFQAMEDYCRKQNITLLEGPFNPNHYSEIGFKIDSFNTSPVYFQAYNPDYYNSLLKEHGFTIYKTLHTRRNDTIAEYVRNRYGEKFASAGTNRFTVRTLRMNNLTDELERVREVFNDAFSGNWRFLPVSREEYHFAAKHLRYVTFPELIVIVEDRGVPVGVLQCVLDINPLLKQLNGTIGPAKYIKYIRGMKKIDTLIIYAVGIKKAYKGTAVFDCLVRALAGMVLNFKKLETTWMSDDNLPALAASRKFGLVPDKHFAMYQKAIG